MLSQTNKQALESTIEKRLKGTSTEGIKATGTNESFADRAELYRAGKGYFLGNPDDINTKYAIDKNRFWINPIDKQ